MIGDGGTKHQAFQERGGRQSIATVQSCAGCFSGRIEARQAGAALQVRGDAAAGVMRRGNDWQPILGQIQVGIFSEMLTDGGEAAVQPFGIAVGDIQKDIVVGLLRLGKNGSSNNIPWCQFSHGMILLGKGPTIAIPQDRTFPTERFGE
jgi:hypothetical protein